MQVQTQTLTFDQMPAYLQGIGERVANIEQLLCSAPAQTTPLIEPPCDVEEITAFLKYENQITVRRLVKARKIPYHQQGRRILFYKSEVNEWIKSGGMAITETLAQDAEREFLKANKKGRR